MDEEKKIRIHGNKKHHGYVVCAGGRRIKAMKCMRIFFGVVFCFSSLSASAERPRILSFDGEGRIEWVNVLSHNYCGIQYTEILTGGWSPAPALHLWNIPISNQTASAVIPLSKTTSSRLFFRVVSSESELPAGPVVGVHNSSKPNMLQQLGARMSRVIIHDQAMAAARQAMDAGETPVYFEDLDVLVDLGIVPVVTLRWPVNPGEPGPDPDRVPTGQDREDCLELVEWFLLETAGRVNHVAINNEPLGGPGRYPQDQMEDGFAWMASVAEHINVLRDTRPELDHLQVIMPVQITSGYLEGTASSSVVAAVDALIEIGMDHADLLDLHLNVKSVAEMEAKLAFLTGLSDVPVVSLEWCQAYFSDEWRAEQADPQFGINMTNNDVILAAYENPMSAEDWASFIAPAPYDPHFLSQAVAVMSAYGVRMAAYAGAWQYGNPRFDIVALLANHTVGGQAPNEPFYSSFRSLNWEEYEE